MRVKGHQVCPCLWIPYQSPDVLNLILRQTFRLSGDSSMRPSAPFWNVVLKALKFETARLYSLRTNSLIVPRSYNTTTFIIVIIRLEHALAVFWCKILFICRFSTLCAAHTSARVHNSAGWSNYIYIQEGSEDFSVGSVQLTVCAEPWAWLPCCRVSTFSPSASSPQTLPHNKALQSPANNS